MMRFTRAARWWFAIGVFLGTAIPCGRAFAGDHLHRKSQLVAVPVTTVTAPAQAVSIPIYSVPVVQAVPMQFSYIQTTQAGAVYLSAPTQGAAVTTAQAPVINIKLEAPSAPATTAPVPQSANPRSPGRNDHLPNPERGRRSSGRLRGTGFADLCRLERTGVSAGGSDATQRCLEDPYGSLQAPLVLQEQVSSHKRHLVGSLRHRVGPPRADTRRAVRRRTLSGWRPRPDGEVDQASESLASLLPMPSAGCGKRLRK